MAQDSKTNAHNGGRGANGTHNNSGSPQSHQGSTATLLGMQQVQEGQGYRTLEDYTASLATLEQQNRQRQYMAREDRQRQFGGSSNPSPVSPASASSNDHRQWMGTGNQYQSQDAIQQYQRMLLDEQRRRNQELGSNS